MQGRGHGAKVATWHAWGVMGEPYECEHGHTCIWHIDRGMGTTIWGGVAVVEFEK